MSQSLNDAESLHTNQHDANVISPVLNSSDDAGINTIKLNTQRLLQQVSKINDTSHGKGNSPSSSTKKGKRSNKEIRKKSRSRREKRKRWPLSSSSAESENEIVDKNFKIIPK